MSYSTLDTILARLRYRTEYLGIYSPLDLRIHFSGRPTHWFQQPDRSRYYELEEEIGPDLESAERSLAWAIRVGRHDIDSYQARYETVALQISEHRRYREVTFQASEPNQPYVKIMLRQREERPGDFILVCHDQVFKYEQAQWHGLETMKPATQFELDHAAVVLDPLEKDLSRRIRQAEIERLESKLRIAHQQQQSVVWLEETRLTGGKYVDGHRYAAPHWQPSVTANIGPVETQRRIDEGKRMIKEMPSLEELLHATKAGTRDQ